MTTGVWDHGHRVVTYRRQHGAKVVEHVVSGAGCEHWCSCHQRDARGKHLEAPLLVSVRCARRAAHGCNELDQQLRNVSVLLIACDGE